MSPHTVDRRPPDEAVTVTTPDAEPPEDTRAVDALGESDRQREQFLPGARFGKRYRIVEQLGRGGMGEVYRADDLYLGHSVALKFLSPRLTNDPTALARLRNEVRVARHIAHPNVCRVYDMAEVDGRHFLSMEYVDGEDLDSVLRRLGRPTAQKAKEIARQMCLGVAAAHERGALHRDLKPANVMIDGRGRVRITDFGVASFARELSGSAQRGGTPAYMAPELLAGQGSSARSDIYSLGLVLYEIFTGRHAYSAGSLEELKRLHRQRTAPVSPSRLVPSIEPEIERVILGCLAIDPGSRPASAMAVASVFPGYDPLAAVRETGDTPSPDVVAEAGPDGALRPGVGLTLLAGIALALFVIALLAEKTTLYGRAPLDKPAVVMQERAREVLRRLGFTERPVDSHGRFNVHWPAVQYFARRDRSAARWDPLSRPGEIGINYIYRQSPDYLLPWTFDGRVGFEVPYPADGNINVSLGLDGRLLRLEATPAFVDHSPGTTGPEDGSALFAVAGLDMARFEPTTPRVRPRAHSDAQAAWTGVLPHRGDLPVRVEATFLAGRPVFFETVTPYDEFWSAETAQSMRPTSIDRAVRLASLLLVISVLTVAVVLAVLNWRRRRGDRKGALRLALFVLAVRMAEWVAAGHHVPSLQDEFNLFVIALGGGLELGLLTWVFYMAVEPYFRRLWPEALVSWTRVLSGRPRDRLVARDVLVGIGLGVSTVLVYQVGLTVPGWIGLPPPPPQPWAEEALAGGRWALAGLFSAQLRGLAEGLAYAFLFLALRIGLRKPWLAVLAMAVLIGTLGGLQLMADPGGENVAARFPVGFVLGAVMATILITLLVRFGLLAVVACMITECAFVKLPIGVDPSAPYFGATLLLVAVLLGSALFAFRHSLAPRRLAHGADSLG